MSSHVVGVLCALASAVVWGSGDFSGGLAARRSSPLHVLALSALSGAGLLLACAAVRAEPVPAPASAGWAALAGVSGALGIAALYRALAVGRAASVAPTAAVISAALPVLFSALTEGAPGLIRMAGFAVAFPGIWLVSSASDRSGGSRTAFGLAVLAGTGFGGFFILIAQVEPGTVFAPLVVARGVMLGTALLLLRIRRLPLPALSGNPVAVLAGMLDAGGNVFYLLAQQFTRLDVAAVLSSLYPVTTVVLARAVLKQGVSATQWLGAALCIAAVGLISV